MLTWGEGEKATEIGCHWFVDRTPPNFLLWVRFSHYAFVKWDRPVFAPEKAVNAPVDVMAEPVSYTNASSYSDATEGLAIWWGKKMSTGRPLCRRICGVIHNCDTIIVNVRNFVEFFLNLCVFPRWSWCGSQHYCQQKARRKGITQHLRGGDLSCSRCVESLCSVSMRVDLLFIQTQ